MLQSHHTSAITFTDQPFPTSSFPHPTTWPGVDFISLSFVKSADPIRNLRSYIESRASRRIEVIAKVGGTDPSQGSQQPREQSSRGFSCVARCWTAEGGKVGSPDIPPRHLPRRPGSRPISRLKLLCIRPSAAGLQIESSDALPNVAEIVAAADGVMVARGDLGAQVPFENVPSIQVRAQSTVCQRERLWVPGGSAASTPWGMPVTGVRVPACTLPSICPSVLAARLSSCLGLVRLHSGWDGLPQSRWR